jgi:hypothetical protein
MMTWGRAQGPSTQAASVITGPAELVEFSSIVTRGIPGRPIQTGRYFRGPDGSDRHEAGPAVDVVELVDIKNIALETNYIWNVHDPHHTWHAHPMQLGGEGRGFPRSMQTKQLAPNPSGLPIQHEGFDVVLMAKNGIVTRRAPALNFLIVDRLLPNGERVTHTNIRVGPVDRAVVALAAPKSGPSREPLFEPPYAAVIEWHTNPTGIITGQRIGGVVPVPPKPVGGR